MSALALRHIIYAFLGILVIILLYKNQIALFVVLGLVYLFYLGKNWTNRIPRNILITGAILGSLGEIMCTNNHVWSYSVTTSVGIPIWLPLAWGLAAYVIYQISVCV